MADFLPLIVLASTSPFRRELLGRLQLPFAVSSPNVDETPLPNEIPSVTAERLSVAKAQAAQERHPSALIIGSDQVAYSGTTIFGKPGTRDNARRQLQAMSGRSIVFHTGLCLLNAATGRTQVLGVPTEVRFRDLMGDEIERYLDKEDTLNCAGSARSEGLGISLMEYMRGDDPNALVGLPLIALSKMLRAEGISLP